MEGFEARRTTLGMWSRATWDMWIGGQCRAFAPAPLLEAATAAVPGPYPRLGTNATAPMLFSAPNSSATMTTSVMSPSSSVRMSNNLQGQASPTGASTSRASGLA